MPVPRSVLIIDDNPVFRGFCREFLDAQGFSVAEAGNGAEALIWLLQGTVNIILLELEVPVLDGRTFLEYRLRRPDLWAIPVLVLTRRPVEVELREALGELGVSRLLGKPVAPEALLGAVLEILEEPRPVPSPKAAETPRGRRDPRIVLSVPVSVRTKRSLQTAGRMYDLSAGGVGAYLPDRLVHGETITLGLEIQGRLFLEGVVQWAGEILTAMGYRHGMRFFERQQDAFPLHVYSLSRQFPEALA